MKTSLTIIVLLITFGINAQSDIASVDTNVNASFLKRAKEPLKAFYLSMKIYENDNFDIDTLLKEAKQSDRQYRVGNQVYSEYELAIILRKGTRTTDTVEAFEQYLTKIEPEVLQQLSERETVAIFQKFRKVSSRVYLNGSPAVVF